MFANCLSMIEPPSGMPVDVRLGQRAFYGMFSNCHSMIRPFTDMNILVAAGTEHMTVMYQVCVSITKATRLRFSSVTNRMFYAMFAGCSSLAVNVGGNNWALPMSGRVGQSTATVNSLNAATLMLTDTAGTAPATPVVNTSDSGTLVTYSQ